jgi:D-arabinose 1-dehydrogenase-like Zn-dependent alcohol dehydrogenase
MSSAAGKTISAFAAYEAKAAVAPFSYEPRPMQATDVDLRISHCGICHSDIHQIDNDWRIASYPLVPGHEIIGTITAVGAEANRVGGLVVGQRMGVGPIIGSCGKCTDCSEQQPNYCTRFLSVYGSVEPLSGHRTYGGFAEAIRVDHRFAFPIPDALPSETAAPLLCAGITVWAPLARAAKAHDSARGRLKVGVVGIGGLGHLALQFASKMGCEVRRRAGPRSLPPRTCLRRFPTAPRASPRASPS